MNLTIKVTKEHLYKSRMCNPEMNTSHLEESVGSNCAIALAVRDIFPHAWVEEDGIIPYTKNMGYSLLVNSIVERYKNNYIALPPEAKQFINKFDSLSAEERIEMSEVEFSISIPDEVIAQLDISEITKQLENHPSLQLQSA